MHSALWVLESESSSEEDCIQAWMTLDDLIHSDYDIQTFQTLVEDIKTMQKNTEQQYLENVYTLTSVSKDSLVHLKS